MNLFVDIPRITEISQEFQEFFSSEEPLKILIQILQQNSKTLCKARTLNPPSVLLLLNKIRVLTECAFPNQHKFHTHSGSDVMTWICGTCPQDVKWNELSTYTCLWVLEEIASEWWLRWGRSLQARWGEPETSPENQNHNLN